MTVLNLDRNHPPRGDFHIRQVIKLATAAESADGEGMMGGGSGGGVPCHTSYSGRIGEETKRERTKQDEDRSRITVPTYGLPRCNRSRKPQRNRRSRRNCQDNEEKTIKDKFTGYRPSKDTTL